MEKIQDYTALLEIHRKQEIPLLQKPKRASALQAELRDHTEKLMHVRKQTMEMQRARQSKEINLTGSLFGTLNYQKTVNSSKHEFGQRQKGIEKIQINITTSMAQLENKLFIMSNELKTVDTALEPDKILKRIAAEQVKIATDENMNQLVVQAYHKLCTLSGELDEYNTNRFAYKLKLNQDKLKKAALKNQKLKDEVKMLQKRRLNKPYHHVKM